MPVYLRRTKQLQLGLTRLAAACDEILPTRHDAALFQQLTAAKWQETCRSNMGGLQPLSCSNLSLRKNGTYNWNTFSDVLERSDTGGWNFVAHNNDSGLLFLGDRA